MMCNVTTAGLAQPKCGLIVSTTQAMAAVAIALTAQQAAAVEVMEPTYAYQLEVNHKNDLCTHMEQVFNARFTKLWNRPMLIEGDSDLSSESQYAFPRLPGVKHDYKATSEMSLSKLPTSPEFDAIKWKEGRAIFGDPPESAGPVNKVPLPILVAYVDFDNDGQIDTVIKNGFSGGYSYMVFGKHLSEEYLYVWRSRILAFTNPQSLWEIWGGADNSRRPIKANASYMRPFIYKAHTYVAQYDMDLGEDFDAGDKPPYRPLKETMSILDLHFSGAINKAVHQPEWDIDTVCQFNMNQIITK